jgi:hypothetical protein
VCVPGRDVAERRGLLGKRGEGALERLDADGVHDDVVLVVAGLRVSPSRSLTLNGRGDNETEGAVGQRKAVSPGQH